MNRFYAQMPEQLQQAIVNSTHILDAGALRRVLIQACVIYQADIQAKINQRVKKKDYQYLCGKLHTIDDFINTLKGDFDGN